MTNSSHDILSKARAQGLARPSAGLEVPDGYFDDFATRMAALLPERPELENREADTAASDSRTFWQKVRPYVYMAAMFAGVWCMLQVFASLTGAGTLQPLSENPVLASALSDDNFVLDYFYDDINSWEVVDEMLEDGTLDDDEDFAKFLSEPDGDYILPQ